MTTVARMVAALEGEPNETRSIPKRFEDAISRQPSPKGEAWKPTELGETLAMSLIALIVRTAPEELATKAYIACEEDDALDRVMAAVRRAVIREVRKAVAS